MRGKHRHGTIGGLQNPHVKNNKGIITNTYSGIIIAKSIVILPAFKSVSYFNSSNEVHVVLYGII